MLCVCLYVHVHAGLSATAIMLYFLCFSFVQLGNSALHLAAMFGFQEIATYLITKHGMSVNEKDYVCPYYTTVYRVSCPLIEYDVL